MKQTVNLQLPNTPSQRLSSSGLVQASKTRLRGASKVRVMAISRSEGVVTCNFPAFFAVLFELFAVSFTFCFIGRSPLSLSGLTSFLLGLQLFEQGVEALVIALPELAVALQPLGCFRERLRLELSRPPLRVTAARNQAGPLQHLEVLGDRRLTDRERLRQLRNRRLTRGEPGKDRPPGRVRERCERSVKAAGGRLSIT